MCCFFVPDDLDVFSVLALAVPPLAVHDGCVHVGRGESVGLVQQRDHAEQDGPERETSESGEGLKYRESNTGEEHREDGGKTRQETLRMQDKEVQTERKKDTEREEGG